MLHPPDDDPRRASAEGATEKAPSVTLSAKPSGEPIR